MGDFALGLSHGGHAAVSLSLLQVWENDTHTQQDGGLRLRVAIRKKAKHKCRLID